MKTLSLQVKKYLQNEENNPYIIGKCDYNIAELTELEMMALIDDQFKYLSKAGIIPKEKRDQIIVKIIKTVDIIETFYPGK